MSTTPDEMRAFVRSHHHCVVVTRRSGDRLQASPVVCGLSEDGRLAISVTEDRAKVQNLRRDPRALVCAFTDEFFGPWIQVEGMAELVPMPEAQPGLRALYRQVSGGEHPDWADFDRAMAEDRRLLLLISIEG